MANTRFTGPVQSDNGFIGTVTLPTDITGNTITATVAFVGNLTGNVTGNVTGVSTGHTVGYGIASIGTLSGAGAIDITTDTTKLTTTGANALTLADGANGQIKRIVMVTDGGDGTLTPTTKTGFSTIVFNDAGDAVTLIFFTTLGWMVLANNGCTIS